MPEVGDYLGMYTRVGKGKLKCLSL